MFDIGVGNGGGGGGGGGGGAVGALAPTIKAIQNFVALALTIGSPHEIHEQV